MNVELANTKEGWRVSVVFQGKHYARYYHYKRDAKDFMKEVGQTKEIYGSMWTPEYNHMYVAS